MRIIILLLSYVYALGTTVTVRGWVSSRDPTSDNVVGGFHPSERHHDDDDDDDDNNNNNNERASVRLLVFVRVCLCSCASRPCLCVFIGDDVISVLRFAYCDSHAAVRFSPGRLWLRRRRPCGRWRRCAS